MPVHVVLGNLGGLNEGSRTRLTYLYSRTLTLFAHVKKAEKIYMYSYQKKLPTRKETLTHYRMPPVPENGNGETGIRFMFIFKKFESGWQSAGNYPARKPNNTGV